MRKALVAMVVCFVIISSFIVIYDASIAIPNKNKLQQRP